MSSCDIIQSSIKIGILRMQQVKVLNVAGPRASEDTQIYSDGPPAKGLDLEAYWEAERDARDVGRGM
jgi:hypothetical protein